MGGGDKITNMRSCGEFNFWCDPEAAQLVLHSGLNIFLATLDLTFQILVNQSHLYILKEKETLTQNKLARVLHDSLKFYLGAYNSFHGKHEAALHDPLAAAFLTIPEIF